MSSLPQGKHRLYHGPEWYEVRLEIPEAFRKWGAKARTSKRSPFSMKKWESEKHKSWSMTAEVFKGHVATDGSLLGTAGKWRACDWSVVQLD